MNTKQYNNIIAHTLENDCVESNSSLETARAVFDNMGVALPSGTMKEVYDTICTDDYMGWRSCTMEEAQEAANNGTAAMGISEDCIVVLSAEDEDEPVAQTETVMTLSDASSAPAAANLQYYAYSSMTTGSSSGIVRIYRTDNTVVFSNSGRKWYCVNHDLIYGDPTAFDDYYETRSCYNTYVRYDPDDVASSDWTLRDYSSKELKLLYIIDPHGVAHYVKKCAATLDEVGAQIGFKDSAFRTLFGRSPKYYARNTAGTWYETTSRDWTKVISESETIFGMHQIYDATTWLDIIQMALAIVAAGFSIGKLAELTAIKVVKFALGFTSNILSLGEVTAINQLPATVTNMVVDELFDLGWVSSLIDVYSTFQEFTADAPDVSDFCRNKLNYCANKTDYVVYLQLKNGQFYRSEDFYNATLN